MSTPTLTLALATFSAFGSLAAAQLATSCFLMIPTETKTLSINLTPSLSKKLEMAQYRFSDESGVDPTCNAWISVPLSAFPSVRLASRPGDFAPAIRETMKEWGVAECEIAVWLENDTGDQLSEQETCISGSFRYEGGRIWPSSSEGSCLADVSS